MGFDEIWVCSYLFRGLGGSASKNKQAEKREYAAHRAKICKTRQFISEVKQLGKMGTPPVCLPPRLKMQAEAATASEQFPNLFAMGINGVA